MRSLRLGRIARLLALGLGAVTAQAAPLAYPAAARGDAQDDYHGTIVKDPYRGLEDLDSEATRRWVAAEGELSRRYLATRPERAALVARLQRLHEFEYIATPFREGGRTYYTRAGGRLGQPVLMMRRTADAAATVALDPNALSPDGRLAVVGYVPSPDGRHLAYGVSIAGSDWTEWRIRDLDSGRDLPERLAHSKYYRPVFTPDGAGLYYGAFPAPPPGTELTTPDVGHAIYYHALGTPAAADRPVYSQPEHPDWQYEPALSDDGRWLVLAAGEGQVGDKNRENLYVLDLAHPGTPAIALATGFDAAYLYVGSGDGRLYFLTSLDAPRGRVIAIDPATPGRSAWREIIAEGPDAIAFKPGSVVHVNGGFVVATLHDAASRLSVYGGDGAHRAEIPLPGAGTVTGLAGHAGDPDLYFSFSNLITPPTVYRYTFADANVRVENAPAVAFDRDAFEQRQVFYTARDGTRIPMLLAYRKGVRLDGRNPVLLYGYGGFANAVVPTFQDARIAWLELGGIYAIANIRGGGEYGDAWHQAGVREHRQTVFDDFAAAAEWLVASGYTTPRQLGIYGRSNGGLLVGASLTQHPELFGAAVAAVGVLDMLRFDRFGQGAGWTGDYGSPRDPRQFAALYAYSPVHRVRPGVHYPPTLIVTGDHDTRVHPMHSFKFAAALQAAQAGPAPILLSLEAASGHAGGTTSAQAIEQSADLYAFLADALKAGAR